MQTIPPTALTSLEREKITSFLTKHPIGVLATVDSRGHPQASTIYFTVSKDLYITFTTKRETHKYENIAQHNTVALVAYDAESQTEVQINGQAIEVTNLQDQEAIYYGTLHAAQQTGEDPVPPIAKIVAGTYVGFAIRINTIGLSAYGWGNNFANAMKHAQDLGISGDPA